MAVDIAPHSRQCDFEFSFHSRNEHATLRVPVTIPLPTSVSEYVGRLVNHHNLPCFVTEELHAALEDFVQRQLEALQVENADRAIARVQRGEVSTDILVDKWSTAFTQEVKMYAEVEERREEDVFAEVYHTLIHSPALETLLNLEHTYALSMSELTEQRDQDLDHLNSKQQEEMELALRNVGVTYTDDDINQLALRQFENTQLISSKWNSELSSLQDTQKREYRDWVVKVHEDTSSSAGTPSYMQRIRRMTSNLPEAQASERQAASHRLEESFTIHLGAQMKTTHNLRLLCTNVLDLCRHKTHTVGGVVIPQPQRLQTAMSLYSNSLCGLILLVDNRLNTYTGIKHEFSKVCGQSTDFHFPGLERQLAAVEEEVGRAAEARRAKRGQDADSASIHSNTSNTSSNNSGGNNNASETKAGEKGSCPRLATGDVYISKHSNLAEAHTVFHLVTDDSVRSGDLTSRHPVILSLRNIIKLCFRYNISTLTIPLLLTHEMTEEMTIVWCMKRAELMFKCVKGFMIEMATYGASQGSRTIQFLVPQGLSEEMFANISNLLPSIFRLSNPLVVKSG